MIAIINAVQNLLRDRFTFRFDLIGRFARNIQGSGKSTFHQKFLADNFVRVNLDTLKTCHQEQLLISDCLETGKSFAIDNTNPSKADRQRYVPLAQFAGYKVVGYLMESKLQAFF